MEFFDALALASLRQMTLKAKVQRRLAKSDEFSERFLSGDEANVINTGNSLAPMYLIQYGIRKGPNSVR